MNIKVDIYLLVSIVILFLFKQLETFLILYFFIILHEAAHIVVATALKIKVKEISFLPFGVNAKFELKNDLKKEIIISCAGPIFSLLVAIMVEEFKFQNLFIFFTNMIPIFPLDGGRILKNSILLIFREYKRY